MELPTAEQLGLISYIHNPSGHANDPTWVLQDIARSLIKYAKTGATSGIYRIYDEMSRENMDIVMGTLQARRIVAAVLPKPYSAAYNEYLLAWPMSTGFSKLE